MKQIKTQSNSYLNTAIVLYLYIPIIIFLLGWTTMSVAVPVVVLSAIGLYYSIKKCKIDETYCCSLTEIIIVFCIFFVFFVVAGHSDLFAQDYDWHKHHAIFNDLLDYKWPVVYNDNSLLTYYIGQYLVPALLGKVFSSSDVMIWTVPVWNAIGLTIVYFALCRILKVDTVSKKLLIILFMLFWGGCTGLGSAIYSLLNSGSIKIIPNSYKWIDLDNVKVHFASNYDALHDAFQHIISPWLAVCFFMGNKKKRESYVMIALPLMFHATFGFIYFSLMLLLFALIDLRHERILNWTKTVFSLGNVILLPLFALFIVYFWGNLFGDKPGSVGFCFFDFSKHWDFYIIFVTVEFLLYSVFIFNKNRKNPLFYIINFELLIMPLFSLGMFNDLCSRGSIPARFILMVLCLEYLFSKHKKDWRIIGLVVLLIMSFLLTGRQFAGHMYRTYTYRENNLYLSDNYKTLEGFAGNHDIREDEAYNYFTMDYQNSPFYVISKKD